MARMNADSEKCGFVTESTEDRSEFKEEEIRKRSFHHRGTEAQRSHGREIATKRRDDTEARRRRR